MTRRSKVAFFLLILFAFFLFASLVSETPQNSKALEEFEERISDPNNDLDPLEEENYSNRFLIDVANKTENILESIFQYGINLLRSITNGII